MSQATTRWLHRIRQVTLAEVGLAAEAQLVLLYCQFVRWRRPVGQLLGIEAMHAVRKASPNDAPIAFGTSLAVTRATRFGVFRPQCLVRALAIQKMLQRRGIQGSELRIGVRLQERVFQAHAWVELSGLVLGDTAQHIQTFRPATDLRLVQL